MTEPNGTERDDIVLDSVTLRATVQGVVVVLTPTEFRLLEHLLRHAGQVCTRAELIRAVIGAGAQVQERTIDVHVNALRRKLGDRHGIETVRGRGYRCR
ncbi:MAG TPA: winged helix-turn-helix domain-containing protein [Gemmataceae bacterium]|nr:winged helix-turn-helix domain-containing protein [Gemmataceae bacterium]